MMRMLWVVPVVLGLVVGVVVALRAGWLLGQRRIRQQGGLANEGLGAIDAAIFGMMGLLLAFTFTGAASRFEHRRDLITEEVNAVGTAWLRLDLLPPDAQDQVRPLFREYLDQRLATYHNVRSTAATDAARSRVAQLQTQIWHALMAAVREDRSLPIAQTVLPPVNEMFDIATTRIQATEQHPPLAIYILLLLLVLVSALHAGFSQAKADSQSMLHMAGFALTTAIAIYLIIDIDYPRLGLVRVDDFDQALIALRASMD